MAEGNSSKINRDGISTEQPASGRTNIPPALTTTRDSIPWLKNQFVRSAFNIVMGLLICITLYSIYVFTRHADPTEVFIFSAARYSPDKPFTLPVFARDAKKELPLDDQTIDLYMGPRGKEFRKLPSLKTGKDGIALASIPPCPAGDYQIKAVIRDLSAVSNIEVKSVYKAMLTSDKPMYQPGQTIHLRSLTLNATDLRPAPENNVNFKIHDPNGNLVLDQTAKSSAYGIAAADFQLADQVNTGEYKITVSEGQLETEKSVEVKNYRLPNYKIALNTDKKFYAPGDTVTGTVGANYIWGTPLANAKITLSASVKITKTEAAEYSDTFVRRSAAATPGGRRHGRVAQLPRNYTIEDQQVLFDANGLTDSSGQFRFKFQIPDILDGIDFSRESTECKITVSAVSPAEYKQDLDKTLIVTNAPLHISWLPEFGQMLNNNPGRIYLFVSDPYGNPVEADLKIGEQKLQTGKNGLTLFSPTDREITVVAIDRQRHKAVEKISLNYNSGRDAFILKTGQSVINAGESLQLEIITNNFRYYYRDNDAPAERVFLDFVKDNTSLLLLPVTLNKNRPDTQISVKIPHYIFGTIQLHAYRILPQGKVERDMRLIQVGQNNPLTVKAQFSKQEYRPGETAQVDFEVKDQNGKPVTAALSIAAVDEMIFALNPGNMVSERAYFLLQEELLKTDYQNQAASILMSDKISNPLSVGFLLENKASINNLQTQCCSPYAARESLLASKKIALDNDLYVCFLVLLLTLLLLFILPLLLVSLNMRREAYWMIVDKHCWKDIQHELFRLQLIFAVPLVIFVILVPFCLSGSTAVFASVVKYKMIFMVIALVVAGLTFMLTSFFNSRNRIFQYLGADQAPFVQKAIWFIPWIYAVYIFVFFCFLLSAAFFPNIAGLNYFSVLFIVFSLFPAFCIRGIRYAICTQEDFDLRIQARMSLGFGIGKYPRYSLIWIISCLLYAGPLVIAYVIFVLTVFAMFMPFCKTIDKLGGGDGRSWSGGSYYYPSATQANAEELLNKEVGSQLLNLSDEQLRRADLPYIRRFFPETLYWQPQLITDKHGNASILFNVADTITDYRFNASAISRIGKLGAIQRELKVFQDFFVDFNPPENVTSGDIISIPVVLYNYMKEPQRLSVAVQADKAFSIIVPVYPATLPPQSVTKSYLKVKFEHAAETKMLLTAIGKNCKDAIERTVHIVPNGKKETLIISDVLQDSAQYKIKIPDNALPEGRDFFMKIYPTPLPQIADTLKGMLREPYGCFEQTTSTTYPNIFIFKYLDSTRQLTDERRKQALEYLNQGYQRMLTFEVSRGGFSWYGSREADVRLSAYGLMMFCDMATVMPVDKQIVERTAAWLEKHQNADGSWTQIHSKSSNLAMTAFVVMALNKTECGDYPASKAKSYIIEQSRNCRDPYTLALCANALLKKNREQANAILERLYEIRKENNEQCTWWEPSSQGLFYSCDVETTALIADAMLSAGKYPATVKRAVIWLYRQGLNRYYSGHTLVQVMRTLINYDLACPQNKADTPFNLSAGLNGETLSVVINKTSINLLQYLPFKQALRDGENIMTISGNMSVMMGFQGVATYYLPNPPKTQKIISKSKLDLSVAYSKNSLQAGDIATCKIYLKNKSGSSVPMGIIVMPVPPGFEVIAAPLEEMVRNGIIDRFETGSNRLTLYFREFAVGKPLLLCVDLRALYPVEITAPALTAYPYYEPENAATSIPEKLTVTQAITAVE